MSAIAWELGPADAGAPCPRLRVVEPASERRPRCVPRLPASVYRRRRVVAAAVVVVAGVAVALALASATGAPAGQTARPAPGAPAETVSIVVGPGDTIVDLAAPHAPAGTDTMAYAREVAAFNDVDPRAVRPGTVLRLPAAVD